MQELPMSTENRYAMDITVETQYVEEHSEPMAGVFSFSYTITITNRGTVGTQLISRHWIIEDDTGERREVRGLGVVACVSGLTITYLVAASPGAMIVVLLVGGYAVVALLSGLLQFVSRSRRHRITSGGRS